MTRPLLILLSITLLVLATAGARAEEPPITKSGEGKFPVTRSDGTVGQMKPPDQKDIKKLVGYIRDGMNRVDWSGRQKQYQRKRTLRK